MLQQREKTAGLLTEAVTEIITIEMPRAGLSPADTSELAKLLLQVGPALVLGGLARLRRGRQMLLGAGQDWYGHQDRGLELDPLDVLVDINRAAADGTPGVAELLLEAFLADLRHAFTRRPASDHAFNCAVLLDNADTEAARDFLRVLLQARSHQREPDPLTVVATSHGDLVEGVRADDGAVTTADGLDAAVTADLAQVAPSVADEVHALARYLSRREPAVLVYDSQASDLYTATLRADFTRVFRSVLSPGQIPYEPGGEDSALFKKIAQDLCANPSSPVVFYAGRNSVFDSFIAQLEQEGNCTNRHLEIVTGGDADGLDPSITRDSGVGAQVSVIYTDIEDRRAITSDFRSHYVSWLGLSALPAIDDPWLLASYNATTAADDAIELAAGSIAQPARMKPTDVAPWLNQLNGSTEVIGATGTFSIGPDGDLANPVIPVYEFTRGHLIQLTG